MAVVIPSWKIIDLLEMDKFVDERNENDLLIKQLINKNEIIDFKGLKIKYGDIRKNN